VLVESSVVEQRYHAVMEVVAGLVPVTEVAQRYGVSRLGDIVHNLRCALDHLAWQLVLANRSRQLN
jgi:hypothetical protein